MNGIWLHIIFDRILRFLIPLLHHMRKELHFEGYVPVPDDATVAFILNHPQAKSVALFNSIRLATFDDQ